MRRQSGHHITEEAGARPNRSWWKVVAMIVGAIITVLLGSTAFFDWHFGSEQPLLTPRFSVSEFGAALTSNLGWLVAFFLLSAAMLPLRALQWQKTLQQPTPFKERWHFVNIGAAVHNLLPGNLGDVTRAFLLARTQRLPFLVGLGSVAVCKLLELAALLFLTAIALTLPFWDKIPQVINVLRWGAWVCAALVVTVIVLARYSRPIAERLRARDRMPRVRRVLLEIDEGLGTARSARGMVVALLFSFPPNLAAAFAYGLGLQALGISHGLLAGTMVLALIALGKGTPGLPTGPGMYFLVVSWAARELGATAQEAAAYALLTNIATGVAHWVPGMVSLAIRRIKWSELKKQTSMAAEAARSMRQQAPRPAERRLGRDLPAET